MAGSEAVPDPTGGVLVNVHPRLVPIRACCLKPCRHRKYKPLFLSLTNDGWEVVPDSGVKQRLGCRRPFLANTGDAQYGLNEFVIQEWNADLDGICHSKNIGVFEQLIVHVVLHVKKLLYSSCVGQMNIGTQIVDKFP